MMARENGVALKLGTAWRRTCRIMLGQEAKELVFSNTGSHHC